MGMFDYFRIGDYCYQTKDLDNFMYNYRIADDLTLEKEVIEWVEVPGQTYEPLKGMTMPLHNEVSRGWEKVPMHLKIVRILGDNAFAFPSNNPQGRAHDYYFAFFVHDRLVCLHKQPIFFINIYSAVDYTGVYRWDDNFLQDWLKDPHARCYGLENTIDVRRMLRVKALR